MKYHTTINISVAGLPRDYEFEFDYDVIVRQSVPHGSCQTLELHKTNRYRHGLETYVQDAEWFWDVCPEAVSRRLDKEMIAEWNRANGLVVPRVQPMEVTHANGQ
jgi:hypothetical protein